MGKVIALLVAYVGIMRNSLRPGPNADRLPTDLATIQDTRQPFGDICRYPISKVVVRV